MNAIRQFYRDLPLKPQGFTMVVAAFLPIFAIIAMFPVVASIIGHFRDQPNAAILVPAMVTAPGYSIALLAPFAGAFVDRFGRRQLLLVCTFCYGLVGAAPVLMTSLPAIIASRLVLGVCEAGILTIVNTLIADYWDDNGRRNWLMLQGLLGPVFQPGVFVLVAVVASIRWNAGFLVYLVAFPIFAAMYVWVFEPDRPERTAQSIAAAPPATAFPWQQAAIVGGMTLLSSIIYYVFIVNGSIIWREIGIDNPMSVSLATTLPSLFVLVGAVLFRVVSRYSNTIQIATMMALFGVGLGGMGLVHSLVPMALMLTFQQTAAGMAVPALIAWSQSKFDFAHRGRGMGIWTSAFFLGQAISPIIVGNIAAAAGSMHAAFLITGLVALAVALTGAILALRAPSVMRLAQSA
jgi:MFS family permease